MFRSNILLCFAVLPAFAQSGDEAALRKTLDTLQGNWEMTKLTVAGDKADPVAWKGMSYRFEGDILQRSNKQEEAVRMTFNVSGKITTFEYNDRFGVVTVGIIQRKGDTLSMCLIEGGKEPPKSFESNAANKATLIEFKAKGK